MMSRSDLGRRSAEIALSIAEKMVIDENPGLSERTIGFFNQILEKERNRGEIFIEPTVNTPDVVAPKIYDMNWIFYESLDDLDYFTSDNPVWRYKPLEQEGSILFPISTNIVLKASWIESEDKIYKIPTKDFVHYVRDKMARLAFKEVFYSKKSELLVKLINSR
jgi:hypothetical protein